jgi:putative SOS response-associated peptidase YedK
MCNLYTPTPAPRLALVFKVAAPQAPYLSTVAPRRQGPFITAEAEAVVGQWGMIPATSPTRTPTTSRGGRMSTNNARREGMAKAWTYGPSWKAGRRCLIPADIFQEPYWGPLFEPFKKSIPWEFARADGEPWAPAGLWSVWTDPETGELVPNYTMLTQNCDGHPLLSLMHRPEVGADKKTLPLDQQDKRAVVPIERGDWGQWLNGSPEDAEALIKVPPLEVFRHRSANPARRVELPTGKPLEKVAEPGAGPRTDDLFS